MKILLLLAMLLVPVPALAAQGQPGAADPQRPVTNSLNAVCTGGGSCPAGTVTQMSLFTGYSVCSASVSGTFSGTLTFEQSIDGSAWSGAYLTPNLGGATVTTATTAFFGSITIQGATWFRVRMSAYTSGTAVAGIYCVPATRPYGVPG